MDKPTWLKKQKLTNDFMIVPGTDPYLCGHMSLDPKGYFLIRINKETKELKTVKGLNNFIILDNKTKAKLLLLEQKENLGVKDCLEKQISIVLTHDSDF